MSEPTLTSVIAVARTEKHDGLAITIMSLEIYKDCIAVRGCLWLSDDISISAFRRGEWAFIRLNMTDDQGNVHDNGNRGMFSGEIDRAWNFRTFFYPSLKPSADTLSIAIDSIEWSETDEETRMTIPTAIETGSWAFAISVNGLGVAAHKTV